MEPKNLSDVHTSFGKQARRFESRDMSFSKQEYLEYTVQCIEPHKSDTVLEAAAGTCACGRALAPFVDSVICLDATPAMLAEGQKAAKEEGISNIQFVNGYIEDIPYPDQHFTIVISRLAFHHFTDTKRAFAEIGRVLKNGGKLVLIDMEAAAEPLRETQDSIGTMRDPSHVKNLSEMEIRALYETHGYKITKMEPTPIPVSLNAWLALTDTPTTTAREIRAMLEAEIAGGNATGFKPYKQNGEIYFEQRWVLALGEKRS